MALDKEDILTLAEALRAADPREMAQREALIAEHKKKREKLEAETKKTKTHAFYRVTGPGYITGLGAVHAGQVIALPLKDKHGDPIHPPHTWESVEPDEDTAAAEPKPEEPKTPVAELVTPAGQTPKPKPGQTPKPKRAADEDA